MQHHKQHGLTKGRSCAIDLLKMMDVWTETLDEGGSVNVIFMAFMKAFDKVPHERLLLNKIVLLWDSR